jgi:hypothetical protein
MSIYLTRRLFGWGLVIAAGGLTLRVNAAAPTIAIKKKYVEITVTIDDALKAYPDLFANLLAEAKPWAQRMERDTTKEWHDNPTLFRDGPPYTYDLGYALRSVVGRYVSVVRTEDMFEGGAHPNEDIDTLLWDRTAQKRISIRPFFTETADNGPTMTELARLARLAVAAEKLSRGITGYGDDDTPADKMTPEQELKVDTFISDGIQPKLLGVGPVTLAPSSESGRSAGLTLHYSPDAVGPHVEGPYTVFVPWTAFQRYLSDQGKTIFAGTRPKDDEKSWQ